MAVLTSSCRAISAFGCPSAARRSTSSSRGVSDGPGAWSRRRRISVAKPSRSSARKLRLAARDTDDRVPDRGVADDLGDVSGGSGLHRPVDLRAVDEGGDDQDPGGQRLAADRLDDPKAVDVGELEVDERDVGPLGADLVERDPAVPGGRDERELSGAGDDPGEAVEEDWVVVCDDDADGHTRAIFPRP